MVGVIIPRAHAGLPSAVGGPRQSPQSVGLVVVHWNGPAVGPLTAATERELWLATYRYHTQTKGWSDVAYTVAVGPATGNLYIGRWLHRVPAAHEPYNEGSWAIFAMVGEGDEITGALLAGIDHAARLFAGHAPITRWLPHGHVPGNATTCPGPELTTYAHALPPGPAPEPEEDDDMPRIDVIRTDNDDVYLLDHPYIVRVPDELRGYFLDLANSEDNPEYRGPWEWDDDRVLKHPERPWDG